MRLFHLLPVVLLALFAALPLHAQADGAAYSVVVPVPDTSQAQRDEAFATALGQVLTRVAGGQDVRSNNGYADAISSASAIVRKFQYQRAADGMRLQVDFEPAAVRRLVAQLGVASVGVKPPLLLLVQGTDGAWLDRAALAPMAEAITARGSNVVYPQAGYSTDAASLAAGDPDALAAVNQRYHTGLVLLGQLQAGGAQWTLLTGGQVQRWSVSDSTEDALLAAAGVSAVERVGRQLNIVGASVSEGSIWVDGLHSALDYANLLAVLRADPAVREASTFGAQDDGVLLRVKATLPLRGLAANLAAGGRVLLQSRAHPGADVTLRWIH